MVNAAPRSIEPTESPRPPIICLISENKTRRQTQFEHLCSYLLCHMHVPLRSESLYECPPQQSSSYRGPVSWCLYNLNFSTQTFHFLFKPRPSWCIMLPISWILVSTNWKLISRVGCWVLMNKDWVLITTEWILMSFNWVLMSRGWVLLLVSTHWVLMSTDWIRLLGSADQWSTSQYRWVQVRMKYAWVKIEFEYK